MEELTAKALFVSFISRRKANAKHRIKQSKLRSMKSSSLTLTLILASLLLTVQGHTIYKCPDSNPSCTSAPPSDEVVSTSSCSHSDTYVKVGGDKSFSSSHHGLLDGQRVCPQLKTVSGQVWESDEMMLCGFQASIRSSLGLAIEGLKAVFCHKYAWSQQETETVFECMGGNVILEVLLTNAVQNNGVYVHGPGSHGWNSPGCTNSADRPLVCGVQPLNDPYDWTSNTPCCCSINSYPMVGNYWQADFANGYQLIDYIQFLGRNTEHSYQSDGIQIQVHTASGWVACDTTSWNAETYWKSFTGCRGQFANKVKLYRTDNHFVTQCGVKVFSQANSGSGYIVNCLGYSSNYGAVQKCDSGKYIDSIRVTYDAPVSNQDKNGITSIQFKCSSISNQAGTRDSSFKVVGTPSGTTQDIYTASGSYFCGVGSIYGTYNYDFIGLAQIDFMLCKSYDCRQSLQAQPNSNSPNQIENRVYKVVPGNSYDFEKPTQSRSTPYYSSGQKDQSDNVLQKFSFYVKNTNTQYCPLRECKLYLNCNDQTPFSQDPNTHSGINDIYYGVWGISNSEIQAMRTSDLAWDSTELFHVTSDPEQLFSTKLACLKCTIEDQYGKSDQTWTSNIFAIDIECRGDISVGLPDQPGSQINSPAQIYDVSTSVANWPRFQFTSFYTNTKACPIDYYQVSKNFVNGCQNPTGIVDKNPYDESPSPTVSGTVSSNSYQIEVTNGEYPTTYYFMIKAWVLGGISSRTTTLWQMVADCPVTVALSQVGNNPSPYSTWIGATGSLAIYSFKTYTPILPICSIVEGYTIIETTVPPTGKLKYPSDSCSSDLCTDIDIDVTEAATILFQVKVQTTRPAGNSDTSSVIQIDIGTDALSPELQTSATTFASEYQLRLGESSDSFAFYPWSCNIHCGVTHVIYPDSSLSDWVTWMSAADLIDTNTIPNTGSSPTDPNTLPNQLKFNLPQSESQLIALGSTSSASAFGQHIRTFQFVIMAKLTEFPGNQEVTAQIKIHMLCGQASITLDTPQVVNLPVYPKCAGTCSQSIYRFKDNTSNIKFSCSSNLCPIVGYQAYDSQSLNSVWNDLAITLTVPTPISDTYLSIETTASFSKSLFVKAYTASESMPRVSGDMSLPSTVYAQLNIIVCGNENLNSIPLSANQKVLTRHPGEALTLDKNTYEGYFSFDSLDHADCAQFESRQLRTGTDCTLPVNPSLFFFDSVSQSFVVDTSNPISANQICLEMTTIGKKSQVQKFQIEVCGNEMVSVSSTDVIEKTFRRNQYAFYSIPIPSDDFNFESSSQECPVTSYTIVQETSSGVFSQYLNNSLQISDLNSSTNSSSSLSVIVKGDKPLDGTFFIKASSQSGTQPAFVRLNIKVCGYEKLSLVNEPYVDNLSKFWRHQIIRHSQIANFFSNNDTENCGIQYYSLLDEFQGTSKLQNDLIYLQFTGTNQRLVIELNSTSDPSVDETLIVYLQATTVGQVSIAYKMTFNLIAAQVDQQIINFAPNMRPDEYVSFVLWNTEVIDVQYKLRQELIFVDEELDFIMAPKNFEYKHSSSYKSKSSALPAIKPPWLEQQWKKDSSIMIFSCDQDLLSNRDNGNWFISFDISDDRNNERQIDLTIELRFIPSYAQSSFTSFDEVANIDFPFFFILNKEFCIINKIDVYLSEFASANDRIMLRQLMYEAMFFEEPRTKEQVKEDQSQGKWKVNLLYGYFDGFGIYQAYLVWLAKNPGKLLDLERIYLICSDYLMLQVQGETCELVKDEDGLVIGAKNFKNQELTRTVFDIDETDCEDPNISDAKKKSCQAVEDARNQIYQLIEKSQLVEWTKKRYGITEEQVEEKIEPAKLTHVSLKSHFQKLVLTMRFDKDIFNSSMNAADKLSLVNDKFISIEVISRIDDSILQGKFLGSPNQRDLQIESNDDEISYAEQYLRFSWNVAKVEAKIIQLDIRFQSPLKISTSIFGPDQLSVKLNWLDLFKEKLIVDDRIFGDLKEFGVPFNLKPTPPPPEVAIELDENVKIIAYILMALQANMLVLNILLSKSLQDLWGMLATQQITIHLMLFSCQMTNPGNVYKFNGNLAQLNQKDMYPTDEIFEGIFDFSETTSPIEHFETLGYEGSNFIEMTGSVLINIQIAILTAVIVRLLNRIAICFVNNQIMRNLGSKLKIGNAIGAILMIYLQGYLEMLICCITSISQIKTLLAGSQTSGRRLIEADLFTQFKNMNGSDKFTTIFTVVSALILTSLPVMIFLVITNNFKTLNEPDTKERYGFLYEGLATRSKFQTLYHLVYILRRTVFVIILIFLHDFVGIQLIAQLFLTLFYVIYFAHVRPFIEQSFNNWEIYNECSLMITTYSLMCIADPGGDMNPEDRYRFGWFYIGVCSSNLIINGLKVAKKFSLQTIPDTYRVISGWFKNRAFKSRMQQYLDDKISFAKRNPTNEQAKLVLEISEMTGKMHQDKVQLEAEKQNFFRIRKWAVKNKLDESVYLQQEQAILKKRLEMREDKQKYRALNQRLKELFLKNKVVAPDAKNISMINMTKFEDDLQKIIDMQQEEEKQKVRDKMLKEIVKKNKEEVKNKKSKESGDIKKDEGKIQKADKMKKHKHVKPVIENDKGETKKKTDEMLLVIEDYILDSPRDSKPVIKKSSKPKLDSRASSSRIETQRIVSEQVKSPTKKQKEKSPSKKKKHGHKEHCSKKRK